MLLNTGKSGILEFKRKFGDWRSDLSTALFGTINKAAAGQFRSRYEAILERHGAWSSRKYLLRRSPLMWLWRQQQQAIRKLGASETEEVSFFQELAKQQIAHQSASTDTIGFHG